jgi:hypothetical protein
MRDWKIGRRKRTRHLIELGGLVVKSGVVDLTGDDRVIILGALLWMADKLEGVDREKALALWAEKGKRAFHDDCASVSPNDAPPSTCRGYRKGRSPRHGPDHAV